MIHERKNGKLYLIIIRNFWSLRDMVMRRKRQATDWDKNFSNHESDKECESRLYKTQILFSHKKGVKTVTCYDLNELWKHYAKWKESKKSHISYDPIDIKCLEYENP